MLELGSGVGHVLSVEAELHYVSMIALYDVLCERSSGCTFQHQLGSRNTNQGVAPDSEPRFLNS